MKDKKTVTATTPIRITESAHAAAKVYVADKKGLSICDFVSDLIIKKIKPKK